MMNRVAATVVMAACAAGGGVLAQGSPAAADAVTHRIVVKTDQVYTGTLNMAIKDGKVSGTMRITEPTEITAKLAGTASDGMWKLDFPFHVTEEQCSGAAKMEIKVPAAPGRATGTVVGRGCGPDAEPITGTVEITPATRQDVK